MAIIAKLSEKLGRQSERSYYENKELNQITICEYMPSALRTAIKELEAIEHHN
tara:strand:+ start:4218 stop:4376 length:159 start_codon:yes stop_codon:yes gene_type:complete